VDLSALDTFDPSDSDPIFGFMDPGNEEGVPGWPLRNFLCLLNVTWKLKSAKIILFKHPRGDAGGATQAIFMKVNLADCT
jgi:hypothetical protein